MEPSQELRDRIVDSVGLIIEEQLSQVEGAIAATTGTQPASISLKIAFVPDRDTGDMNLDVTGKSSIPGTPTNSKVRLANGKQLELI